MKNLQQVSELYWYDALNLLSYTTLDVKNMHSVVQHKDKLFMLELWKCSLRGLDEDNPLGGVLFNKSKLFWYPAPERSRSRPPY